MQYSHSRVDCFESCKYKYRLRYIDRIKTIPPTAAANALILGTALHTGIEDGVEAGIKAYCDSFPIIDDAHINEIIKLEYLIPKVRAILPDGLYEQPIADSDFIGFSDLLVDVTDKVASFSGYTRILDLYDFKYSNNVRNYMDSGQLHEYKYFIEKNHPGWWIRTMNFVFIPKVSIKQKKTEDLQAFRNRIMADLRKSEVKVVPIEFDYSKVIEFMTNVKKILECEDFDKEPSYLCNWCEYQEFCERGIDYMLLPKNERRNIETISKKVMWLYGAPFSGKTFLANRFPDPIMLNTDGNIKFVDAPFVAIRNEVEVVGRQTKTTLAWQVFKDAVGELEKKDNDFKTVVVDLLEDCYEHCRVYMYDKLNISHESDDSFSAWDKVRTEFLSTMKRLMNMDYENIILISHEDRSKDITRKGGDKITAIKPNLQDKVANKMAGMVDIVARVVADGDERTLSFKTNEVIFGGGRLVVTQKEIPLDYEAFMDVYEEANTRTSGGTSGKPKKDTVPTEKKPTEGSRSGRTSRKPKEETPPESEAKTADEVQENETIPEGEDSSAPKVQDDEPAAVEPPAEEAPKPRQRKKRGE